MNQNRRIYLQPEPEGGYEGGFRLRNEQGEDARTALIDHGENLIVKANIVHVAHGTLSPEGTAASLLIFEFHFITENASRRFKMAKIQITFSKTNDSEGQDPEVSRIAPEDTFRLNQTNTPTEITHSIGASVNTGGQPVSGNLGYKWEVHRTKTVERFARLSGVRRVVRSSHSGRENTAIWIMHENPEKKDGIPSFLRAAVVLTRRSPDPFTFMPEVRTEVDFQTRIERLFGKGVPEPVDDVRIDPTLLQIEDPIANPIDLSKLAVENLWDHCRVIVATIIEDGQDRPGNVNGGNNEVSGGVQGQSQKDGE